MHRLILSILFVALLAAPAAALTGDAEFGNDPEGRAGKTKNNQTLVFPGDQSKKPDKKDKKPKKPHPGDVMIIKKDSE